MAQSCRDHPSGFPPKCSLTVTAEMGLLAEDQLQGKPTFACKSHQIAPGWPHPVDGAAPRAESPRYEILKLAVTASTRCQFWRPDCCEQGHPLPRSRLVVPMPPFRRPETKRHSPLRSDSAFAKLLLSEFPRENRCQLVELLGSDAVAVKGLAIQLGTTLDGEEISEELFGGFQFGWGCEA